MRDIIAIKMSNKMKKVLVVIFSIIMTVALSACGSTSQDIDNNDSPDTLTILCADFPEYDWVKNIVDGSNYFSVELLNDSGADLHSFQPSVSDIAKICDCNILIYNGGESESWIGEAWENNSRSFRVAINLMKVFQESPMFPEYEDNDDEHLWLSPRLAKEFCGVICDVIKTFDSQNVDIYDANYVKYANELSLLETSYSELKLSYPVLIADRMPFNYLFEDCGIECYAAFDGCSAETEASFETIVDLANVIINNNLKTVFYLDGSTDEIAQSVIQASEVSDVETKVLNSLQSISKEDISSGVDYISIMKENLDILKTLEG